MKNYKLNKIMYAESDLLSVMARLHSVLMAEEAIAQGISRNETLVTHKNKMDIRVAAEDLKRVQKMLFEYLNNRDCE